MPLQMPHVSVCDSHSSLPQSKHCVLAVLEQGKPSASDEFLTSTTSQRLIWPLLNAESHPEVHSDDLYAGCARVCSFPSSSSLSAGSISESIHLTLTKSSVAAL